VTLILREMRHQARVERLNPHICDEIDVAVIDACTVIGPPGLPKVPKLARVGAGSDKGKAEQAARKRVSVSETSCHSSE
jgi:hypothetical protein